MASKNRRPNTKLIEQRIRSGFGQGHGADYKPWTYIRDVPSKGTSNSVHSPITGRNHHYLSVGEQNLHFIVEYYGALDIREQYALLPWKELQAVAAQVGIRYPVIPYTKTPAVLTTDMVVTLPRDDGRQLVAVAVKEKKELDDERVLEKLWLERYYWMSRGIEWLLHLSDGPTSQLAQNLRFFEGALRHSKQVERCPVTPIRFSAAFENHWRPELTLQQICTAASAELELGDPGDALRQLGAAVWQKSSRIVLGLTDIQHNRQVTLTEY